LRRAYGADIEGFTGRMKDFPGLYVIVAIFDHVRLSPVADGCIILVIS